MHTNTKHFARNPLEMCLLCFCCVIFVYLLNTSKQIQQRQEAVVHQYLTFAGYFVRTSFEQNPIVSPDHIVWEAEEPFLEECARLDTIIEVSIKQLEEGIVPEDAEKDAKPVPLGENQTKFVEERLADAAMQATLLNNKRMVAVTEAKKQRDETLADMIQGRYRNLLSELNDLFELVGPFFFVYYPETDTLYTDSSIAEEDRFQVLRLLKTHRTIATNAHISLISVDKGVQLGAYMPANYNNPIVIKTIKESIPTIVLTLVFPCVICSFFTSSFLRAHKRKELAYRIKRALHTVQDFKDRGQEPKKQQRKRYHDFRAEDPIAMALYGASDRSDVPHQGSLIDNMPDAPVRPIEKDNLLQQFTVPSVDGKAAPKKSGLDIHMDGHPDGMTPHAAIYGALWVQNFLSMETTPVRKQLDRHTNIPTRTMFLQMLQELWIKRKYLHAPAFLAHFDVDNLEEANSLLGYTAGNTIIYNMIAIISAKLGKNGIIGRLSSDNFICIYVGSEEDFIQIVSSSLVSVNEMLFDGRSVFIPSASAGITRMKEHDRSIDDGQRRAITALYQAKNDGKNCYRIM